MENLDEKSCRIALNKDYGHYLRAILCFFRPDFPQNPCSTDFSKIILMKYWLGTHVFYMNTCAFTAMTVVWMEINILIIPDKITGLLCG